MKALNRLFVSLIAPLMGTLLLFLSTPVSAQITIHGYVYNAGDRKAIKDADVYYFDKTGKKISALPTNSEGRYSFQTTVEPGYPIIIKAAKNGFKAVQSSLVLRKEGTGDNNKMDFYLYPFAGIEVTGHINDAKGKPVSNAVIKVPNPIGQIETFKSKTDGSYEFNTFYEPGQSLSFRIELDGYHTVVESRTIRTEVEGNRFDFELKRVAKFRLCDCFLYGSGATALLSAGMYWRADNAYNSYKDFGNPDRNDAYSTANASNRVSIVSGGIALGLLGAGLICKRQERKEEENRQIKVRRTSSFMPLNKQDGISNMQIGIAYRF
jgi:hypothetical protein